MASYNDRANVDTLAASFPEARVHGGLFDTDISGLAACMSLKTGTTKNRNLPEYEALILGRGITVRTARPCPKLTPGRAFTTANGEEDCPIPG